MSTYGPGNGGAPPPEGERPPVRRSRSRSPAGRSRRRRSHSSHSRRSHSRSRSPPVRRRSRSPRWRRSRSRSLSRSRSRSPPRGRGPYRDNRDRGRERYGPPQHHHGGPYGPPPDDFRGYDHRGGYGRDMGPVGPPPPFHGRDPYFGGGPFGGPPGGPPYGGPPPPQRRGERRRRDEGPPGVSLLIRNVSPDMTTHDLQMAFGRIGNVRDVYIPRDFHSQQPKGFAFIEYATPEMAREARDEMDRFVVKGRELEVVFAQERRKTPNEMRGRVVNSDTSGRDSRRSNGNFERSSSFERHREKERQGGGRDLNNVKSESNAPRSERSGGGGKAD